MGIIQEFQDFLKEYKVMPLAIAFIMGFAIIAVVNSLVNDIIMPVITPLIPGGDWQTATLTVGPVVLKWGSFLSAMINFVIIAFVVFMIVKLMAKGEKITKKIAKAE